jgi:hypothetical protein
MIAASRPRKIAHTPPRPEPTDENGGWLTGDEQRADDRYAAMRGLLEQFEDWWAVKKAEFARSFADQLALIAEFHPDPVHREHAEKRIRAYHAYWSRD